MQRCPGSKFGPSATGSFKDRAASICVSKLVESGVKEMAISSTGNVAASFAAYSARAGIRLWIFMPEKVNTTKFTEVLFYGHHHGVSKRVASLTLSPFGYAALEKAWLLKGGK